MSTFTSSLLVIMYVLQVWSQTVTLTADKKCYDIGESLVLNAAYVGNDSVSVVEWNFKPGNQSREFGSGLNIRTSDCRAFGSYPGNFPGRKRVSFDCDQNKVTERDGPLRQGHIYYEDTFLLKIIGIKEEEERNATWTVRLWLWNALPLTTESVVIHDCKDIKYADSTTTVSTTASHTAMPTTTVSTTASHTAKSTPDIYNIIGK